MLGFGWSPKQAFPLMGSMWILCETFSFFIEYFCENLVSNVGNTIWSISCLKLPTYLFGNDLIEDPRIWRFAVVRNLPSETRKSNMSRHFLFSLTQWYSSSPWQNSLGFRFSLILLPLEVSWVKNVDGTVIESGKMIMDIWLDISLKSY